MSDNNNNNDPRDTVMSSSVDDLQLNDDDVQWDMDDDAPRPPPSSPLIAAAASSSSSSTGSVTHEAVFPDGHVVRLMSFEQILQHQPHLNSCSHGNNDSVDSSVAGSDAAAAATASSGSNSSSLAADIRLATAEMIEQQHLAQSRVDPWQSTAYCQARASLAIPSFVSSSQVTMGQLTQAEFNERLRAGLLRLEIQSSSLESFLLVEAGRFEHGPNKRVLNFPPCVLGKKCIGHNSRFFILNQTRGITWTSVMFESEVENFTQTGSFFGKPRMCVLDHRMLLPLLVYRQRLLRMKGAESTAIEVGVEDASDVLQAYRNLVDQVGGYHAHYMTMPEVGDPMIQPIVSMNCSSLKAVCLPTGQWRVNQDMLIFQPAPNTVVPVPGESIGLF